MALYLGPGSLQRQKDDMYIRKDPLEHSKVSLEHQKVSLEHSKDDRYIS
jgi:hypothetical protein